MSVDPVVAGAAAAPSAGALIEAELGALAAGAQALQAQLAAGDVVSATVLPSNGLTDLLAILGNRVSAALPPNLQPGDVITAQVTGFNGPQILLQILEIAVGAAQLSPAANGGESALAAPPPFVGTAEMPPSTPVAPPAAVFVAASVRPSGTAPAASAPAAAGADATGLAAIEARLAAARAGAVAVLPPETSPSSPAPPSTLPLGGRQFVVPPPIQTSSRFVSGADEGGQGPTAPGTPAVAAPASRSNPAFLTDPVALVRALRLPVTPTNVAAAKLALDTPQRLPAALATLERALPAVDDPRIATLRTLTAFLGKIDAASPQLPAQIAAYVEHVVDGYEPKLAQLLSAQLAAEPPPEAPAAPSAGTPSAAGAPAAEPPAGSGTSPAGSLPEPALPVVALAAAAERTAALVTDLKAALLAVLGAPPAAAAASEDLIPAAATALTAVTAVQLNAAQALAANPATVSFAIPIWQGTGYAQARIAVDRDAPDRPGGGAPLDGDNFHIAFLLDTKHLGTVAIDLQTVGRSVAVAVKTEAASTATRFGSALGRLTDRLESLRYRVASAEAAVAPAAGGAPGAPEPGDPDAALNVRA